MSPQDFNEWGFAALWFISLRGMWESTPNENSGGLELCAIKIIFTDKTAHLIHIPKENGQTYFIRILLMDFAVCSVL